MREFTGELCKCSHAHARTRSRISRVRASRAVQRGRRRGTAVVPRCVPIRKSKCAFGGARASRPVGGAEVRERRPQRCGCAVGRLFFQRVRTGHPGTSHPPADSLVTACKSSARVSARNSVEFTTMTTSGTVVSTGSSGPHMRSDDRPPEARPAVREVREVRATAAARRQVRAVSAADGWVGEVTHAVSGSGSISSADGSTGARRVPPAAKSSTTDVAAWRFATACR